MNILPDELSHLKGTVLGDMLEARIIRSWIGTIVKAILVICAIAVTVKIVV